MAKQKRFRLLKTLVIPAGTVVHESPARTEYHTPHGEILIGFDRDTTGTLRFDAEDAIKAGVIEEVL